MLKGRREDARAALATVDHADEFNDSRMLAMLRAGDEEAFVELVGRHHTAMVRLARSYVPSESIAEEVVQETWVAVLRSLPSFEGRSSVKTWLYRILVNRARTVGAREFRLLPISDPERAVSSSRFGSDGAWSSPPVPWVDEVDDRVRAERLAKSIRTAIEDLPVAQRDLLILRDLQGMTAAEACKILDVCGGHQRVLLHRARSRLRNVLEAEFAETPI